MNVRYGKRRQIRFTDKSHPLQGILSVLFGVLAWADMITLCLVSGSSKGHAGIFAGILGILALILGVIGFVLAMKCYRKEDIYMVTPMLGTLLNVLIILACVIIYVLGAL
ncbi:MAG: DUF6142 family protein [Eubacterium sp.]|nr:DUF6142 family protein [Eubacterium sp.]